MNSMMNASNAILVDTKERTSSIRFVYYFDTAILGPSP